MPPTITQEILEQSEASLLWLSKVHAQIMNRVRALLSNGRTVSSIASDLDCDYQLLNKAIKGVGHLYSKSATNSLKTLKMSKYANSWNKREESLNSRHWRVLICYPEEVIKFFFELQRFLLEINDQNTYTARSICETISIAEKDNLASFLRPSMPGADYFSDEKKRETIQVALDISRVKQVLERRNADIAEFKKSLLKAIHQLCEANEISQGRLAEITGYSQNTVKTYFSAVSLTIVGTLQRILAKLCEHLKVDVPVKDLAPLKDEEMTQSSHQVLTRARVLRRQRASATQRYVSAVDFKLACWNYLRNLNKGDWHSASSLCSNLGIEPEHLVEALQGEPEHETVLDRLIEEGLERARRNDCALPAFLTDSSVNKDQLAELLSSDPVRFASETLRAVHAATEAIDAAVDADGQTGKELHSGLIGSLQILYDSIQIYTSGNPSAFRDLVNEERALKGMISGQQDTKR